MKKETLKNVLDEVEMETLRFLRKVQECKDQKKPSWQGESSKENASVKRAALDLKNELTRITQSTIY